MRCTLGLSSLARRNFFAIGASSCLRLAFGQCADALGVLRSIFVETEAADVLQKRFPELVNRFSALFPASRPGHLLSFHRRQQPSELPARPHAQGGERCLAVEP